MHIFARGHAICVTPGPSVPCGAAERKIKHETFFSKVPEQSAATHVLCLLIPVCSAVL